ncbi:MAG: hypothetical protein AB1714_10885 [Acidobacteriota bacterium]
MRNCHVPVPDDVYFQLSVESKREGEPITVLVRRAIERWLAERKKAAIHDSITAYARKFAGTDTDLDASLEASSVEHLLSEDKAR